MSVLQTAVDQEYIELQTIQAWESWNTRQRLLWLAWHGLPLLPHRRYEDLPNEVKDALFVEYLDNAKKDLDSD